MFDRAVPFQPRKLVAVKPKFFKASRAASPCFSVTEYQYILQLSGPARPLYLAELGRLGQGGLHRLMTCQAGERPEQH